MSKTIDTSDLEALDYNDLVYLRDRDYVFPEDFEFPEDPSVDTEDYKSFDKSALEAEIDRRNSLFEEPYLEHGTVAKMRKSLISDDNGEFASDDEG